MEILIAIFGSPERDNRTFRQIQALKDDHRIQLVSYSHKLKNVGSMFEFGGMFRSLFFRIVKNIERLILQERSILWRIINYCIYLRIKKKLSSCDLVILHDVELIELALLLKKWYKCKVVWDLHDYYPEHFSSNRKWMMANARYNYDRILKNRPYIDKFLTVSKGLQRLYRSELGVSSEVVENRDTYSPSSVKKNVNGDCLRYVYHGRANPARRLELILSSFVGREGVSELFLYLVGHEQYQAELRREFAGSKNIHFLPAVEPNHLVKEASQYDIGICFFPPETKNLEVALPNKFFQYVQSRLLVVSGPTEDITRYINQYDIGFVSSDFTQSSLEKTIAAVSPLDVMTRRVNVDKAAQELKFSQRSLVETILSTVSQS